MYANNNNQFTPAIIKKALWGVAAIIFVVVAMAFIRPWYNVWSQEMEGKAEFAKAEQNRKIKIEEAKANLEAEKLNAQAEIERAKGAAEAIRIAIGLCFFSVGSTAGSLLGASLSLLQVFCTLSVTVCQSSS